MRSAMLVAVMTTTACGASTGGDAVPGASAPPSVGSVDAPRVQEGSTDEVATPSTVDGGVVGPVQQLLTQRHAPPCDDLPGEGAALRDTLRALVERAPAPSWVPMRAARCLLTRFPAEAEADALRWVSAPSLRGLALLTAAELESVPLPVAERIARAALAGPHAAAVRPRLAELSSPALRTLVEATPASPAAVSP